MAVITFVGVWCGSSQILSMGFESDRWCVIHTERGFKLSVSK